jgi:hypothetical protein
VIVAASAALLGPGDHPFVAADGDHGVSRRVGHR